MPYQNRYEDPQEVAEYLAKMDFSVLSEGKGDFSPEHVKYDCELKSGSHEFRTSYQSNPSVHGQPTVADVFSALVSDALTAQGMGLDDFADELGFDKPSAAIRAYDACKKTLDWLRTDLYLGSSDLSAMSATLDENLDEVKQAVATLQQERAEKEAFEHPPVPRGFVTIDSLEADLDLGDYGDQCPDYSEDYVGDCFSEVADSNVDVYTYDLLKWLPDNYEWIEEADAQGLLEGCHGDLPKMISMAQYECFTQDMHDHREDICKYATLESLKENGLYAVSTDMAETILGDIDYEDGSHDDHEPDTR